VREVNLGFNLVPGLLSRKVDAVLGAFWNYEGVQLERERRRPQIIRMEEVGVPTYDELVLVAAEQTLNERGALVRRFLRALQDGTRAVRADPAAGVDPLLEANRELDRGCRPPWCAGRCPCSSRRTRAAVRLDGGRRVGGLRDLDAAQRPARGASRRARRSRTSSCQARACGPSEEQPGAQGQG
jgi:hypothetical protein